MKSLIRKLRSMLSYRVIVVPFRMKMTAPNGGIVFSGHLVRMTLETDLMHGGRLHIELRYKDDSGSLDDSR